MINNENQVSIQDNTANPAPLGLAGFGLTTILLNLHNIGLFDLDTMILGMGLTIGGLAQVIVGIMEWKKRNTFGTTAFTAYGFFWIAFVALLVLPKMNLGVAPNNIAFGSFLIAWGIFSIGFFICTFKQNLAMQLLFGSLVVLFFLLGVGKIIDSELLIKIAGYEGVFCGLVAVYTSMALVINEVYNKTVLSLVPVNNKA